MRASRCSAYSVGYGIVERDDDGLKDCVNVGFRKDAARDEIGLQKV